jgi:C-terminal processing protease CtpA/Prc
LFIKSIRDYKETPIGDIYEDVKGYKQPTYHAGKFYGKVYLLINANTFSTALGFATVIKDYNIATIIGEQTKAEVNEFGDIFPFDLPKSRLWVWCSAKRYIRPSGELTIGGLNPDILISDQDNDIINFTINNIKNK